MPHPAGNANSAAQRWRPRLRQQRRSQRRRWKHLIGRSTGRGGCLWSPRPSLRSSVFGAVPRPEARRSTVERRLFAGCIRGPRHAAGSLPGFRPARRHSRYPRTWRPIRTDPGTASVALIGHGRSIRGYLNATPARERRRLRTGRASGSSTCVRTDSSKDVRLIASAHGLTISLRPRLVRDRQLSHVANPLPRDRVSRRGRSHQFRPSSAQPRRRPGRSKRRQSSGRSQAFVPGLVTVRGLVGTQGDARRRGGGGRHSAKRCATIPARLPEREAGDEREPELLWRAGRPREQHVGASGPGPRSSRGSATSSCSRTRSCSRPGRPSTSDAGRRTASRVPDATAARCPGSTQRAPCLRRRIRGPPEAADAVRPAAVGGLAVEAGRPLPEQSSR